MTPPNLLTEWARLLMGSLREAGLRQVVLSPGSRSTPFAWAALQDPGLECRVIIDERSAAFFALGHARTTGRPALLLCTSGSAAANYFPAVVEAAEAHVPLLVLTADRPLELQGAAAPQTIDQVKLYGAHARASIELGTPDPDPRMLRAIPRLAAQAVWTATGPVPGPVQINARARKPLEPWQGRGAAEDELRAAVDRLLGRVPVARHAAGSPDPDGIRELAAACRLARRGLIVCGPAHPRDAAEPAAVAALADATGFPVVAEAASQLRFADAGGAFVADAWPELLAIPAFREAHVPDLLVQVGRPPTASAWHTAIDGWADNAALRRFVLAPHGWPDPSGTATGVLAGPVTASLRALVTALDGGQVGGVHGESGDAGEMEAATRRATWLETVREANRSAREVIEESLDGPFTEGAAVRAVVARLQAGSVLAVGNSLPIREVDTFVPAGPRDLAVWFQRGANGIDGLISGAVGATAASGRPVTLLLGDVSFLHDLGGLRAVRDLPAPLRVVVLNNGGGRIFERLPVADTLWGDPALDAWLTPPDIDMRAAAATFGLPFARAEDVPGVEAALDELADTGGVLEIMIPPAGTTTHQRELRRRLETLYAS